MKIVLTLGLALVLGSSITFGVMGCNKPTTEKKVTTETTAPAGTTKTETKVEETKTPEKK